VKFHTKNYLLDPACTHLNLACGTSFITEQGWINVDFAPAAKEVLKLNLLDQLPFPDHQFQAIYSSHFLEHVPIDKVQRLLLDWRRLLKPGGRLRLVLPDFQILARRYLELRDASRHREADAVLILAVDQCVRRRPGGMLKNLYQQQSSRAQNSVKSLLAELDGIEFNAIPSCASLLPQSRPHFSCRIVRALSPSGLAFRWRQWQRKLALALLSKSFVAQNVSFAAVGELHQWLWDEHQLFRQLSTAGFEQIERFDVKTSGIKDFPFYPLDIKANGTPRKGSQSMVLEAVRPV
jgi:hypothetical protein